MVIVNEVLFMVLSVLSIKLWDFASNKGTAISFQLLIVLLFGNIIVWASGSIISCEGWSVHHHVLKLPYLGQSAPPASPKLQIGEVYI